MNQHPKQWSTPSSSSFPTNLPSGQIYPQNFSVSSLNYTNVQSVSHQQNIQQQYVPPPPPPVPMNQHNTEQFSSAFIQQLQPQQYHGFHSPPNHQGSNYLTLPAGSGQNLIGYGKQNTMFSFPNTHNTIQTSNVGSLQQLPPESAIGQQLVYPQREVSSNHADYHTKTDGSVTLNSATIPRKEAIFNHSRGRDNYNKECRSSGIQVDNHFTRDERRDQNRHKYRDHDQRSSRERYKSNDRESYRGGDRDHPRSRNLVNRSPERKQDNLDRNVNSRTDFKHRSSSVDRRGNDKRSSYKRSDGRQSSHRRDRSRSPLSSTFKGKDYRHRRERSRSPAYKTPERKDYQQHSYRRERSKSPVYKKSKGKDERQPSHRSEQSRNSNSQKSAGTKSRSYFIDNVDEMTCDISQLTANDWEAILGPEASSKDTASLKTAKHDLYDIPSWIRMSPADLHFKRNKNGMQATERMLLLEDSFHASLVNRSSEIRTTLPKHPEARKPDVHKHSGCCGSSKEKKDEDSDTDTDENDDDNEMMRWLEEMQQKRNHPDRLHPELWYNEVGQMLDGPVCRCSLKQQRTGIRHNIYPGEQPIPKCAMDSNNEKFLYHYRITMSPHTNFLSKDPTLIRHDSHEYIFEGFSIFSHYKLDNIPECQVSRFNIDYSIHWIEEEVPTGFTVRSLDLFTQYLYYELLELLDLDLISTSDEKCSHYHLMPRFARELPDNGKELLSMDNVLKYLINTSSALLEESQLNWASKCSDQDWQKYVSSLQGMLVTKPGMRPACVRLDQLDRKSRHKKNTNKTDDAYPVAIHFGTKPAKLSYVGDPKYQALWKEYVKFKHLMANKPKLTPEDKQKLMLKEHNLQAMRLDNSLKREITIELSAKGILKTGIRGDVSQHAMLLPVLINHFRFHRCLNNLEDLIGYHFNDRMQLQLALTHSSYRVKYGTNQDHVRNSLTNCGIRMVQFGDHKPLTASMHKRGINRLISIMARMGCDQETDSDIRNYERLEFLGDAVIEFLSSIHLYFMFTSLDEGGLTTYRTAIVQNQHLAVLAKKLKLDEYMLYTHGPDLCSEGVMEHAMANCLEALMGALYLDGGLDVAERVFGEILFGDDSKLANVWKNLPPHPLQEDEPNGDRNWIASSPVLQKIAKFEDSIGVQFNHIRLLARAFTSRSMGYNNLTLGHNQRLEFLGDTVLQIMTSVYLFTHFPDHHEGHLSLLRSSLVNNFTQAIICDDLGMTEYLINGKNRVEYCMLKTKEKADLLESFLGALYVDKGLEFCETFCAVCFFPRLRQFIINQDWNDAKSRLQQCCLTLRGLNESDPDVPLYKVISCDGPTNTRRYTVAVYFRDKRLDTGMGHSIHQAEMEAAEKALTSNKELFPQLNLQNKLINKRFQVDT